MATTTFTNGITLTDADWFNDLDRLHYDILNDPADLAALVATLGATNWTITGNLSVQGGTTIGNAAGDAFTIHPSAWTLSNSVTVTGTFANLGTVTTVDINGGTIDGTAIGGTTPAAGAFTTVTSTGAIKNGTLTLVDNRLEDYTTNGLANIAVNYNGYLGGTTQFRNFLIYDGKQNQIASFSSTGLAVTGALSASGDLNVSQAGSDVINPAASTTQIRIGASGFAGLRIGVDNSFNIDTYNSALPINVLKITQAGAATFNYGLAVTGALSCSTNLTVTGGYIEGAEQTAPAAPAANGYRIFAQDNGAGKTQLMVRFASGASQQIAIEP